MKLEDLLAADLLAAIEDLVDARVRVALALHEGNGTSPWLTLEQAAERLSVSPRTISRMAASGRLRTSTVGRRVLVHRDSLDQAVRG
jgi:excisionase family DNA binding protein